MKKKIENPFYTASIRTKVVCYAIVVGDDPGTSGIKPESRSRIMDGLRGWGRAVFCVRRRSHWKGLDNTYVSQTWHSLNCQSQLPTVYTKHAFVWFFFFALNLNEIFLRTLTHAHELPHVIFDILNHRYIAISGRLERKKNIFYRYLHIYYDDFRVYVCVRVCVHEVTMNSIPITTLYILSIFTILFTDDDDESKRVNEVFSRLFFFFLLPRPK